MPKLTDLTARAKPLLPGLMLSATIAAAASFLGAHYGAPVMLFALLLGMAFNFMHTDGPVARGSISPRNSCCGWGWGCWASASRSRIWRRSACRARRCWSG